MLLNGGQIAGERILKRETVEDMLSQQVRLAHGLSYFPEMAFGYGLGVRDDASPPARRDWPRSDLVRLREHVLLRRHLNEFAAVAMTQYYGPESRFFSARHSEGRIWSDRAREREVAGQGAAARSREYPLIDQFHRKRVNAASEWRPPCPCG